MSFAKSLQRRKFKAFFKSKEATESTVEFLKYFIIPFAKNWNPLASVDDAISVFFSIENRKFFLGTANTDFKMPGRLMIPANYPKPGYIPHWVKAGAKLIIAVDRIDNRAKIDVASGEEELTFILTRPEFEFLKDKVEIKEI